MTKSKCFDVDLGNITVINGKRDGALVNFSVVLKQLFNYSEYAIALKLKVNRNDGRGYVDAAFLTKLFKVRYEKNCNKKLVNWCIEFNDIVIDNALCGADFHYKLEFIAGNYVRFLNKEAISCEDDILECSICSKKSNKCFNKHIGTFTIRIPSISINKRR